MNPIWKAYWIAKGVGWDNVPRRVLQSIRIRSGYLRRQLERASHAPEVSILQIGDRWSSRRVRFFPTPSESQLRNIAPTDLWRREVTNVCTEAIQGEYPFFSHGKGKLGWPPEFNRDPVNGIDWPSNQHWLSTAKSGPPRNDIKLVWEASRFSLAFYFAREFTITRDAQWAERYWEMFDAWVDQNACNQSVAWGCGQEIAFRLMAMLMATFTLLECPSTTSDRLRRITELCWLFASRIEANINYAISQENNHSLSEATGLWTVGLLFEEFPESKRWIKLGRSVLDSEIERQVYADGSYVQNSMNYHRVMLDVMVWAIELGKINNCHLADKTVSRVAKSTEWLRQLIDVPTGRVPNYGANDGANVLPVTCCDYLDFRPTLAAACQALRIPSGLPSGPWDEKVAWFVPSNPLSIDQSETNASIVAASGRSKTWVAPEGGYYVLKSGENMAMLRATKYRDRPSQCDMLHLDLRMKGCNVLRDSGTFRYYHEDATAKRYFYSVAAHNTVQVDHQEQMQKGPQFLWFRWPEGRARFEGDHRLVCSAKVNCVRPYTHRRTVELRDDTCVVEDTVEGASSFAVRWHLAPEPKWISTGPGQFFGKLDDGSSFVLTMLGSGAEKAAMEDGWESLHYGERSPIQVVAIERASGVIRTTIEWSR
jgi:hypothetical protein